MNILVTGIAGFVGSHLAEYILSLKEGHEIYGVVRPRTDLKNIKHLIGKIKLVECDLTDLSSVSTMMRNVEPKYIFHLAAQSDVAYSFKNPEVTISNNFLSQLNMLECIRRNPHIYARTQMHIAGSSEEYGDTKPEEFPIKESTIRRPLSPYAVSKVLQEELAMQYVRTYDLNIVVTRAFNHTGPRRGANFAESSWAKQIAEGNIVEHGNLDSYRDYTDVRDMVRAYWLAITRGTAGEAYNVCSGVTHRMGDVLDSLISISGKKVTKKLDEERMRPSDVMYLLGDYTKFKVVTGWTPLIPIEDTLRDLYNYHKKNV